VAGTSLAAGGALIPAPLEAELLRQAQDSGVGRGLARKMPMTSVQHLIPSLSANVQIFVVAETGAATESNPTFGQSILKAIKFMGLGAISREELSDAAIGVSDLLRTLYGEQLGLKEDAFIFEGDGIGVNPVGVIADPDVKEIQASIAGSPTNGGPVAYADLVDVVWKGRKRVTRSGAAWVGPPNMVRDLLKLEDTAGNLIFRQDIAGLATIFGAGQDGNLPDGVLMNKPFHATDEISVARTVGSATNCGNAYFGPWANSYILGDLLGIQWGTSEHVHWTTDLISVRLVKRTAFLVAVGANFTKYTGVKVG
jgi:HK97 family phage major capsid protein